MVARAAERDPRAHARVERLLRDHRSTLLGIARRWTGSADEAEDALQRALEIYVRRLSTLDPATELGWMKVVVRHEAMALGRARSATAGASLDENELADRLPASDLGVHERIERDFRVARSLEALAQLKPDERTALLLKAEGFSYREIGERQGWTYTKVNRAITEGRRRFMTIFARIESGEECERFAPTLRALVQGEAAAADVVALRPHLRHCSACRAAMRGLHSSLRHRLVLHLPVAAGVAPVRWLGERVAREPDVEGGVARGVSVKQAFHGLVGRFTGPDVAAGVQLGSSGGGRGPAVAALLSLCLGGGAGTYCVAGGVLPDPTRLVHRSDAAKESRSKREARERQAREARAARARATPEPVVSAPPPPLVTARVAADPGPGPEQRSARKPGPKRKAKRADSPSSDGEFGFEGTTGTPGLASAPTGAPAATAAVGSGSGGGGGGGSSGGGASSAPPPTSGGEFFP